MSSILSTFGQVNFPYFYSPIRAHIKGKQTARHAITTTEEDVLVVCSVSFTTTISMRTKTAEYEYYSRKAMRCKASRKKGMRCVENVVVYVLEDAHRGRGQRREQKKCRD